MFSMTFYKVAAQNLDWRRQFVDPGKEYRPHAYWDWLNGAVSKKGLTHDLEEAKAKGLGGLLIWDVQAMINPDSKIPGGPPFMSEASVGYIHHAMAESKRLDFDLGLVCASGWNAGGSWVTPEMAGKNLFFSEELVSGPKEFKQKIAFPVTPSGCPKADNGLPVWYEDVAVLAWPEAKDKHIADHTSIINLSDRFKDGELTWSLPPGDWHLARFVCTNNGQQLISASPNSNGPFIDFLDPEATRFHFNYIIKKLGLSKGKGSKTPLISLDDDSMELFEGIQWSKKFRKWFQQQHGYDPVTWLPVLMGWTIEDSTVSNRFEYDYRKSVSDLLIASHYKTGSEVCSEYGLQLAAEAGGPGLPFWNTCPVDALKALGNVSIPRGEFWLGNPRNLFLVKEIASASHIYGKPYVDAESWTTWRRWRDGPFTCKLLVDRAFCEGLNKITYHSFAYSPGEFGKPGHGYHAGIDMNPRTTWWPKAKPFMDYLSRCCYMLRLGRFVADVAYYYGDEAPNFWPYYHDVPEKPMMSGLGAGYDYDVVNTDVILNRMTVKQGKIVLPDGMSYRVLVLPDQETMPLKVLLKLRTLVAAGATVMGPKPMEVPGMQEYKSRTAELRELANKMWGDCNGTTIKYHQYGKGTIVWGYTAQEWLERLSLAPDFSCKSTGNLSSLDHIHRELRGSDIYFVRNKTTKEVKADCFFRVKESVPQLWDPSEGTVHHQFVYQVEKNGITLPIVLPPGGSVFVVFERHSASDHFVSLEKTKGEYDSSLPIAQVLSVGANAATVQCWQNGSYSLENGNGQTKTFNVNKLATPVNLDSDWVVDFDPNWGAPPEIKMPKLISWTDHANDGIKFYSGSGFYHRNIDIPAGWLEKGRSVYLDLGDVREVAEIVVNGHPADVIWKPPFRAEITSLLKPGINTLKIQVINLWINRLTGDSKLPDDQKYTRTNIRSDGSTAMVKAEPWRIIPAGLLGPVRLIPSLKIDVRD